MSRLRIPDREEMLIVLNWGGLRLAIALGQLAFFLWKKVSQISFSAAAGLELYYNKAIVHPFDALIWHDATLEPTEETLALSESIELFDWNRFQSEPDRFPHIRVIGKSGMGKTVLARYIMALLGGKQCAVSPKAKPNDWKGIQVFGVDYSQQPSQFRYREVEWALEQCKTLMYANYEVISRGLTPEMANIAIDEWRSSKENIPSASDTMKELISVARDGRVRLIAIATGEQVKTWGLEGESDLEECFSTIRLGEFAIEYAKRIKLPKRTLEWLTQQQRPCMVERYPASIPDLRGYQFPSVPSPFYLPGTSNSLPTHFQPTSEGFPKNTPGSTAESGFQPPEALRKENFSTPESPENDDFPGVEGDFEAIWQKNFWPTWQAIRDNKSNYWIGKNIFGVTGGSGYQQLSQRLDEVRGIGDPQVDKIADRMGL